MRVGSPNTANTPRWTLDQIAQRVLGMLLTPKFLRQLIDAMEAISATQARNAPGRLLAGKVGPNSTCLITGANGVSEALCYLNGGTTLVSCYVPSQLRSTIAINQDIWILPINGNLSDLVIAYIRNY